MQVKSTAKFIEKFKVHLKYEHVIAMENCLGCYNCGTACAWYLSSGDKKLHPYNKKNQIKKLYKQNCTWEGKLLKKLGLSKKPTEQQLKENMLDVWNCTACGRCTMACPMGLDNRSLIHLTRTAYNEAGFTQDNPTLKSIDDNIRVKKHSFGLDAAQVFLTTGFFLNKQNVQVPIDVPDCDYLFACPSVGNTKIPHLGGQLISLLNAMETSYTLSSQITDTGTEVSHISDNPDYSRKMLLTLEQRAMELNVKSIIVAECGCDVRTFYVDSAEILGRPFKVPVTHIDTLLLESLKNKTLPYTSPDETYTYHDPCKVERLSKMGNTSRELFSLLAKNISELSPNYDLNYCCNGGSGPMRLPELTETRRKASVFKANQIKDSKADKVVTPCAVCMLTIEDVCTHYKLKKNGRMSHMLFELVYTAVKKAIAPERFITPKVLKNQTEDFIQNHTVSGFIERIKQSKKYMHIKLLVESNPDLKQILKQENISETELEDFLSI